MRAGVARVGRRGRACFLAEHVARTSGVEKGALIVLFLLHKWGRRSSHYRVGYTAANSSPDPCQDQTQQFQCSHRAVPVLPRHPPAAAHDDTAASRAASLRRHCRRFADRLWHAVHDDVHIHQASQRHLQPLGGVCRRRLAAQRRGTRRRVAAGQASRRRRQQAAIQSYARTAPCRHAHTHLRPSMLTGPSKKRTMSTLPCGCYNARAEQSARQQCTRQHACTHAPPSHAAALAAGTSVHTAGAQAALARAPAGCRAACRPHHARLLLHRRHYVAGARKAARCRSLEQADLQGAVGEARRLACWYALRQSTHKPARQSAQLCLRTHHVRADRAHTSHQLHASIIQANARMQPLTEKPLSSLSVRRGSANGRFCAAATDVFCGRHSDRVQDTVHARNRALTAPDCVSVAAHWYSAPANAAGSEDGGTSAVASCNDGALLPTAAARTASARRPAPRRSAAIAAGVLQRCCWRAWPRAACCSRACMLLMRGCEWLG